MAHTINSDEKLVDSKEFYLNNGDLILVREGKKEVHYLVSSYVDPEESHTATYCVLIQMATGNKITRHPHKRTTNIHELVKMIRYSYYHKGGSITKDHVTIIGRDFYDINIKAI